MVDVPSVVAYGRVVGRFVSYMADTPDAGNTPDEIPLTGKITLTPLTTITRWPTADPPRLAIAQPVIAPVMNGNLTNLDGSAPEIYLAATNQPEGQPNLIQWRAQFRLDNVPANPPDLIFNVPANGTVDLALVASTSVQPGTVVVVSHEDALAAAKSAEEAAAAADAAVAIAVPPAVAAAVPPAVNAAVPPAVNAAVPPAVAAAVPPAVDAAIDAEDIPGQVVDAIAADSTVIDATADAVSAAIAAGAVVGQSMTDDVNVYDWAFITSDLPAHVVFGQRPDGSFYGADSIVAAAVAAVGPIPTSLPDPRLITIEQDGWSWAFITSDSPARVEFGQRTDGTFYGITESTPIVPVPNPVVMAGDSLTENWGNTSLAAALGRATVNLGIGGQTSPEIAARFGGQPTRATVAGGIVPASGGVAVTLSPSKLLTSTGSFVCYIGGVRGSFVANSGDASRLTGTFTRTAAGLPVHVGALAPVQAGYATRDHWPIFCYGRNNFKTAGDEVQVVKDLTGSMEWTNKRDHALILSIPPWPGEYIGGIYESARIRLDTTNKAIKDNFPRVWLDTATFLQNADVITASGQTPTSEDLNDISIGQTPRSFRNGDTDGHYNSFAYAMINQLIAATYSEKGWNA